MILWISKKIPRPKPYQPRDVIAVDINERKIVYGDDKINKERDTNQISCMEEKRDPEKNKILSQKG
jgi:hypothetical protein